MAAISGLTCDRLSGRVGRRLGSLAGTPAAAWVFWWQVRFPVRLKALPHTLHS